VGLGGLLFHSTVYTLRKLRCKHLPLFSRVWCTSRRGIHSPKSNIKPKTIKYPFKSSYTTYILILFSPLLNQ